MLSLASVEDVGERLDSLAFGGHIDVGVLARDGFALMPDDVSGYGIADPGVLEHTGRCVS